MKELLELRQANEWLQGQFDEQRRQLEQRDREYAALLDATKKLQDDRDKTVDHAQELAERISELEVINRRLNDMLWGRRSERRVGSCSPLLFPEMEASSDPDADVIIADQEAQAEIDEQLIKEWEERRRKRREQRRKQQEEQGESFPEHFERRERLLDLEDDAKVGLQYIGDAVTERLRFKKPEVYVERIVRRKYVVAGEPEQGVLSPPAPLAIVEGCRYGFDVIAAVISQKYAFHQPTYRQQDWFAQCGWFPCRSTLNDLLNHSVEVIDPLFQLMWQRLLDQRILHVDETTALVLLRDSLNAEQQEQLRQRQKKKPPDGQPQEINDRGSATSYAWLFAGLDQLAPYNVFHWSFSRSHAALDEWLAPYQGTVVADAYEAYVHLGSRTAGRIVHASCNQHARREFVKAEVYQPILCAEITALYRHLYAIEDRGQRLTAEQRLELRQREAVPAWNSIQTWLESDRVRKAALPKSPFGKAVGYLRNQWDALQRYLSDGQLPIDNNQAERVIRPLTVGRRNWLFFGHPQAAAGRLQLMSIVSSAHRHHLIVENYLCDVLEKLADAAQHNPSLLQRESDYLAELLPDRWAATHPSSTRVERVAESQDRAETKRVCRARRRQQARAAANG